MSNPNKYNYDPQLEDLIFTFANVPYKVRDYAADTKFTISYEEDFRTETVGVDGDSTTNENHNRNAIITARIKASSPLRAVFDVAAFTGEQFAVARVNRNFSGDVGNASTKAYFTKMPDESIGKEEGIIEYPIRAINLKKNFVL